MKAKMFKIVRNNSGFGLVGIMVGFLILSIVMAASLPYLEGENNLSQANGAINTANSLINSEIQYQQASYSNDAESGNVTPNTDYFGTVSQMISGMSIKPGNYYQQFLSNGYGLSLVSYQSSSNCINKLIGNNTITECLTDESNGQFKLSTYRLNSLPANYVTMFSNDIKGGVSTYANNILVTQVSVPFGFSAYPKIQGNNTTTVNNNTTVVQQGGGGGGASAPLVQCTETSGAGSCLQYTYSNGAQVSGSDLTGIISHPGQVCIESMGGICEAWGG